MLSNFQDKPGAAVGDFEGIENRWELIFKLHVDDGTNNGNNLSIGDGSFGSSLCFGAQKLGSIKAS